MKKTVLFLLFIGMVLFSVAETVTYTRYQSGETATYELLDWTGGTSKTVAIPQFNPTLGTLTKADLTIQYDISQNVYVENTNDSAVNVRVRGLCIATWTNLPNSIVDEEFNTRTNNSYYDYTSYDGITDYAGTSGREFLNLTDTDQTVYAFTSTLAAFIGTGTMDASVDTESEYSIGGASNIDVVLESEALATAIITYTYDPVETLPVELASFTAVTTSTNLAQINWATHSETGVLGFNVFRSETDNFNASHRVNASPVAATNTSVYQTYSYVDTEVQVNTTYYYWLENQELDNTNEVYGPVVLTVQASQEDVEDINIEQFAGISSIYPNPFNPTTTIRYFLNNESSVNLEIYNLIGQRVYTQDLGSKSGNAYHTISWNGKTNTSQDCASGVYFFRVISSDFTQTTKAILSK